ncbi:MAG: poly-beta-1,6-N-acetyl-D-glucosamine N-deacetylase PgaB, partial [Syntrophales bacterium]|nr:poly-beta-1,6-N-acetyl-D-glucosamine N-deacetylase PgaB [Syntrophales bacterium]
LNDALKVRMWKDGKPAVTDSWYRRLTPFDPRSLEAARKIFRDLAANVHLDGILIQDDAYLAEMEDFHPAAVEAFRKRHGVSPDPEKLKADRDLKAKWVAFKTEALNRHVDEIAKTVRVYRPEAAIARNIYAGAVLYPESKAWFAQDFGSYLGAYDYQLSRRIRLHRRHGLRGHGGDVEQPHVVQRTVQRSGRPRAGGQGHLQAPGL